MIVSACEALSRAICAFRSVSESWYVWTAVIRDDSVPRPARSPANMSSPYSESSWRTAMRDFGRVRLMYLP